MNAVFQEPILSEDPFCLKPTLEENLNVIPDKKEYEVGDEIIYQCLPHQDLSHANSSICGSDGKFTGTIPTCVNGKWYFAAEWD